MSSDTVQGFIGRERNPFLKCDRAAECGLSIHEASAEGLGFRGHVLHTVELKDLAAFRRHAHFSAGSPVGDSLGEEHLARLRFGPFDLPRQVDWALAQGWQCWSESPVLNRQGVLAEDRSRDRWCFGDTHFYPYEGRPGCFHSWFFSYCGSLEDPLAHGFLCADGRGQFAVAFAFDLQNSRVWIDLDCAGFDWGRLSEGSTVVRFVLPRLLQTADQLPLSACAQAYLSLCRPRHERAAQGLRAHVPAAGSPLRGYTSWYHHYQNITEDLILQNLSAAASEMSVFQIDDGYQVGLGQWTSFGESFSACNTPRTLMQKIRAKGLSPGVWLAPFVALPPQSAALSAVPLLRSTTPIGEAGGDLVRCGTIDHWGGSFFAVDTESTVFHRWIDHVVGFWKDQGAGFLKCDFLYAAGMVPGGGMTRLERAIRAHVLLDQTVRRHGMSWLSCGAILEQGFLSADFSRIGADVGQVWEDPDRNQGASRERVSTRSCITNTVTRSLLSGAAYLIDGDVTIVRDTSTGLTAEQKQTLLRVNGALSDLQFVSCDLFAWSSGARERYTELIQVKKWTQTLSLSPRFSQDEAFAPADRRGWATAYAARGLVGTTPAELQVDLPYA